MGVYPPGLQPPGSILSSKGRTDFLTRLVPRGMGAEDVALSNVDHPDPTDIGDSNQLHDDAGIFRRPAARRVRRVEVSALEHFYSRTDDGCVLVHHRPGRARESHVVLRERKCRTERSGWKILDVETTRHEKVERVDDIDGLVTRAHERKVCVRLIESAGIVDGLRVRVQRMEHGAGASAHPTGRSRSRRRSSTMLSL